MEKGEKRGRKRSRKASESEQALEEPPSPPGKTRKRSGGGRQPLSARGGGRTRNKVLKVSFDIVGNNLNVGDGVEGSSDAQCTLSLASTAESAAAAVTEVDESRATRPGNGAEARSKRDVAIKKPPEIKFKNNNFTVS